MSITESSALEMTEVWDRSSKKKEQRIWDTRWGLYTAIYAVL